MGTAVSWSSVLHHRPHSIIPAGLTEPCPVCQTGVRPQAAELSAYVEKEKMKRLQQKAGHGGGNEGPRQPLLVSPCLVVATDIPRSLETSESAIPSGEISICSTHEHGMSKLLSSSSLPCWEKWGWGGGSDQGWAVDPKLRSEPLPHPPGPSWGGSSAPPGEPRGLEQF